jgi:hypothetical protein
MEKRVKEFRLAKISALTLSLIIFVVSIIISFVLEYVKIPDATIGIIEFVFFVILIPIACFVICKIHPKSVRYTPFLCNPVALLGTIFHPLVWTTLSEYLLWVGSLVLSILAAIVGAKIGLRKINQAE